MRILHHSNKNPYIRNMKQTALNDTQARSNQGENALTAEKEETQGVSLMPPAFSLTADSGFPVQRKQAANSGQVVQRVATPTVPRGGGTHTVVAGDNLWTLARRYYGHGPYWQRIKDANPDLVHGRSLIHPGAVLTIPIVDVPIQNALDRARGDQGELRDVAELIPQENFDVFMAGLTQDQIAAQGEFLQMVDLMRRTGMTIAEMGEAQRIFLEGQAAAAGQSVGEYIAAETATRGYGGGTATWWPSLTPEQQADYETRFRAVVDQLRATAPANVQQVISTAESQGGGFRWAPEQCEIYGAFGYTNGDWTLYVGQHWLEAAEDNLERVYANIAHEMGGHNEYGNELGWDVMSAALDSMPESERNLATAGGNSVFSAYGYMETEIWAELREHEYDRADNPTDHPFEHAGATTVENDVQRQLQRIQHSFAPAIAEALVRSLYQRASHDSRITPDALSNFAIRISNVFGFTP
ncbi:MAG: LysM peptidoglycan-binding domain-containing protein [Bacteroidia bacterium]|nr:LysM peptidoglycan-binding domain-containing protein [Bacteroidia bacterium]